MGFTSASMATNGLQTRAPVLDHNGNLLTLFYFGDAQTHLIKIAPDGVTTLWDVIVDVVPYGPHIIVDANDNVYVDTYLGAYSIPETIKVTKVNANGTFAWGPKSYTFGLVGWGEHMQAGPMALAPDGSLYVLGIAGQSQNAQPAALFRIDSATGAEKSPHRDLPLSSDDGVSSLGMDKSVLATDSAGNVYYGGPEGLWSFSADLKTSRWANTVPIMPRAMVVDSANNALFITGVGMRGTRATTCS